MTITIPEFWLGVAWTVLSFMLLLVLAAIVGSLKKSPRANDIVVGNMRARPHRGRDPTQLECEQVEALMETYKPMEDVGFVTYAGWDFEILWPKSDAARDEKPAD